MQVTQINQTFRIRTTYPYWTGFRLEASHYQYIDHNRLVIHLLEVESPGHGYGRRSVELLQREHDEIHIFPVKAKGFWEKLGFVKYHHSLPIMAWSRTAN